MMSIDMLHVLKQAVRNEHYMSIINLYIPFPEIDFNECVCSGSFKYLHKPVISHGDGMVLSVTRPCVSPSV
jgi:hypothetical protein